MTEFLIRDRKGRVINRSRNMAGVRRYAGKVPIVLIDIAPMSQGRGRLYVRFDDGATFRCEFADFNVLCEKVGQWRNAQGVRLTVESEECGQVNRGLLWQAANRFRETNGERRDDEIQVVG